MSDGRRAAWPGLMARAQAGDSQAYARLLTEIAPPVAAFVRRKISDPALAEDIAQDVLLTVHRIRHTYDPARPFLPWLAAIASARSIDALRRRGRREGNEVHDELAFARHADPDVDAAENAADAADDLSALLATLPERQRDAVELVKLREMSLAEAARATDLSVSAMKALLHRALVALRARAEESR